MSGTPSGFDAGAERRTLMPVDGAELPSARVVGGNGEGARVTLEPIVEPIPTPTSFEGGVAMVAAIAGLRLSRRLRAA